jgi:hypothetical protein
MGRTVLVSFAGAGIGFLGAVVIVRMMAGSPPPSDTAAITLFVGTFLSGTGAIAGAIIGAAAEFFQRAEQVRQARGRRDLESQS